VPSHSGASAKFDGTVTWTTLTPTDEQSGLEAHVDYIVKGKLTASCEMYAYPSTAKPAFGGATDPWAFSDPVECPAGLDNDTVTKDFEVIGSLPWGRSFSCAPPSSSPGPTWAPTTSRPPACLSTDDAGRTPR
jgi:hypothetical protein